ncbi:hypothetical protein LDL08_09200 [Nonomuraea glycinis]|uniref:Secreted protein n=1 Tax=Nonomuraea glycinis TaxID=2047744 RepID=A0A918E613_9ACTN|nr:hypothetical protein [Nonomuraea glycinis]MCA2176359.1 hypothetical protein [Nonomuraea glycinis]GGP07331.1 hypothetical protein GCM10012278_34670 [Nonomuraea glycinis]
MAKRWIAIVLAGSVGLGTVIATAQPGLSSATVAAPLQALSLSGLNLRTGSDPYTVPPAAEFEQVGIDGALTGSDRTALPANDSAACAGRARYLPSLPVSSWFCWDSSAQGDKQDIPHSPWVPQGMATSGEAQLDGTPIGSDHRALITSWTWLNSPDPDDPDYRTNSVNLSVVNLDDRRYRKVLPVWVDKTGSMRRVYGHGGGLAWYGPYVFMTSSSNWNGYAGPSSTAHTIRVFDTRKIYRKRDGTGGDYRYVMPEVRHYLTPFLLDYVSLDRHSTGGATLIGGSYKSSSGSAASLSGTRLIRYRFQPGTDGDYRLNSTPVQAFVSTTPANKADAISDVQGVHADGDRIFLNMSAGAHPGPDPRRRFATVEVSGAASTWTIRSHTKWGYRPEDLSLWYGTGELWGLTEGEEERVVYSVKLTDLNP